MFALYVIAVILFFPVIYWFYIFYVKYKDFRKLPGPTPIPVFGNSLSYGNADIINKLEDFYKKYKPTYVIYTGFTVRVFHSKPEHIQYIINSTVNTDRSQGFEVLKYWLGDGLITSNGCTWRQRRKVLNQSFSINKLEGFLKVFNEVNDVLLKMMESETTKERSDVLEFLTYSSFDTVLETMMGVSVCTQQNRTQSYCKSLKEYLLIIGKRFFSPLMRIERLFLMFSKHKDEYLKLTQDLIMFTEDVINNKVASLSGVKLKNENKGEYDKKKLSLLDLLLDDWKNGRISYEGVREELDTIMAAGHETTAGLLAFCLYELSRNQDVQQTLYEEIVSTTPSGDFTMNQLANMTYLDAVIKETLRIHTVVPFIEREISESFVLDGLEYPAGTTFTIPLSAIHQDPDYFPNPHKFDPSRFSSENIDIKRYVYLPFSGGPRICIGYKYAMLSAKCAIAKCVREYAFLPVENFQMEKEYQITLKPSKGAYCKIRRR